MLYLSGCKLDNQVHIVGLGFGLVGGTVSDLDTAPLAAVNYDKSALRVGERPYRSENSAAGILSVAGVDIDVKRREAEGTVVA